MHIVTGQLTCRRAVSKNLVFYDMLCTGGGAGAEESWMEVVVKLGTYGSTEDVKDLRDLLKLGDVVSVQGHHVSPPAAGGAAELQATAVTVLQAWRESNPGCPFTPRPAPQHSGAQQQQQRGQQQQKQQQQGGQQQQQQRDGKQQEEQQQQQQQRQQEEQEEVQRHQRQEQQQREQPGFAEQQQQQHEPENAALAALAAAGMPAGAPEGQPPTTRQRVCKYFVNTGRCAKGSSCGFAHLHTRTSQQAWVSDMLSERQARASAQGFAHTGGAAAKGRRAQLFAAWLVHTFGREALNAGQGVLDVAGGAGGVTFELSHVHGVRCTLVDPRPLKLNKQQRRQLQAAGRPASICTLTEAHLQEQQKCVAQPRPLVELAAQSRDSGAVEPAADDANMGLQGAPAGAEHPPAAASPLLVFRQVQGLFSAGLWRSNGWRQRFPAGFSVVVACHPDQATDPALEFSLEAGLPFAIVPCCVFPRLFSHRRLLRPLPAGSSDGGSIRASGADGSDASVAGRDGDSGSRADGDGDGDGNHSKHSVGGDGGGTVPVLSYPDLVEYLTARGQAQQAVLAFEGANIVVWRHRPQEH